MNIKVKQIWSVVITFLQTSGKTEEKILQPTALIEWEAMEFTELKFCKDIGLCFTALVTSFV